MRARTAKQRQGRTALALASVLAATAPLAESCMGFDANEPRESVHAMRISCQDSRTSSTLLSVVAGLPVQVQGRCDWQGVEEVEFRVPCGEATCSLTLKVPGQASFRPGVSAVPLDVRVKESGTQGSFSAVVELSSPEQ